MVLGMEMGVRVRVGGKYGNYEVSRPLLERVNICHVQVLYRYYV